MIYEKPRRAARVKRSVASIRLAARMLDKARADLLGINGEYNFYPCGLGAFFLEVYRIGRNEV